MTERKKLKGKLTDRKIKEIVFKSGEFCLEKKASDVLILHLKGVSDIADYFLIAEGFTDIHVRAVSDHLVESVQKKYKIKPWHVEGMENARWVLLDYIDFVVHIFQPETRKYYQLEKLWADAKRHEIKDEAETGGEQ